MEKKKEKPKKSSYYDIKVETLIPATLTFRVLAESAEEAASMIKKTLPRNINYKSNQRRDLKVLVYQAGTSMLEFIKNL